MDETEMMRIKQMLPNAKIEKRSDGEYLITEGLLFKVRKTKFGYEYYLWRILKHLPENGELIEKLIKGGDKNERISKT